MIGRAAWCSLVAFVACAAPIEHGASPGFANPDDPSPVLGARFGGWHVITGEFRVGEGKGGEELFFVRTIDGAVVDGDMALHAAPWSATSWFGRGDAPPRFERGVVYELHGFESGRYVGLPDGAARFFSAGPDDFGPPQSRGYCFRREFVFFDARGIEER